MTGQPKCKHRWPGRCGRSRLLAIICTATFLSISACRQITTCGSPGRSSDSTFVLQWRPDTILLEENQDIFTTEPVGSLSPSGNLIIADLLETQVRVYARNGKLRNYFSTTRADSGLFRAINDAVPLLNGEIAILGEGVIAIASEDGHIRTAHKAPYSPGVAIAQLDSSRLAIAGRRTDDTANHFVHIWNFVERRNETSFFQIPRPPEELEPAYYFSGFGDIAVRGDTIAAVFALTDSIYLFLANGERLGSIHLPAANFRPISTPMPSQPSGIEFQKWLESFSTLNNVYWTSTGGLVVQYFDVQGFEPVWRVIGSDRTGRLMFEHSGSKLLAISDQDSLFFISRSAESPNRLLIATLESLSQPACLQPRPATVPHRKTLGS